jgi:DNA repair and recombination protein RAD54B
MSGTLGVGDTLKMGNKDIEVAPIHGVLIQIDSILSKEDYLSGKSFISTAKTPQSIIASQARLTQFIPPSSTQTIPQYRTGLFKPRPNEPRHDPTDPDAIVLPRPPTSPDKKIIDIVLDPLLVRHLRPHQKEGVRFLYECVMGLKHFNGRGAILADEMGLGKTLTVIALIWTLLSISLILSSDRRTKSLSRRVCSNQKGSCSLPSNAHCRTLPTLTF